MAKINFDNLSKTILDDLKKNATGIVSGSSLSSPRAVGDAVQSYLEKGLAKILKTQYGISLETNFTRRSIEDMAFTDADGNYYAIDVKTHNTGTVFNMPNLTSVNRLANFYKESKNNFCILIISYYVSNGILEYTNCHFNLIESFSWDCLTLGALGWGQIQIANANTIIPESNTNRKKWMKKMCDMLSVFYDKEEQKIQERKKFFESLESKSNWQ